MKKKLNLPVCLFILALILCIGSVHYSAASVQAATVTKKQIGFVKKNGNWYYYDKNGKKATGWYQSASGNKYYFGKTGAAKAGILTISGKKYCFNSKGKARVFEELEKVENEIKLTKFKLRLEKEMKK